MAIVITSRTFYDEYLGVGGGGTNYLLGSVGDRITARIDFYVKWAMEEQRFTFATAADTITLDNLFGGSVDFESEGFKVGDEITISGTASNNGVMTITAIDGDTITVGTNLVNETAESANIYGTTDVEALDFYYNILENGLPEDYYSLLDTKHLQRYKFSPVLATSTVSAQNARIASDSLAWVTHTIDDLDTGETSDVTCIGMGISADYKQQFRIEHTFLISPLWLRDQLVNFTDNTVPSYFDPGKALKHITKIEARYDENDPEVVHEGSASDTNGLTCWFDRNPIGTRTEYYLQSVAYEDADTADVLDVPDIALNTKVTMVIKSRTGLFVDTTKVMLGSMFNPLEQEQITDTSETTMLQNLYHDRFLGTLVSAAQNGANYGTAYQVLTNITCVKNSAETATITFTIALSTAARAFLSANESDNRRSTHWIAIKDPSITATKDSQKMAVLGDSFDFDYTQDNLDLFAWSAQGFALHTYPDTENNPAGDTTVWSGDPLFARAAFQVLSQAVDGISPTIREVKIQVIAQKTGASEFVLEEQLFDFTTVRKLKEMLLGQIGYVQTVDVDETRGFTTYTDDPFNLVRFQRDPEADSGFMRGYVLEYGFVARYEYWASAFPAGIVDNTTALDITESIEDVTHEWSNYNAADSWSLVVRVTVEIEGYDGHVTSITDEKALVVRTSDTLDPTAPVLECVVEYFDEDETESIGMIIEDDTTLIRATFTKQGGGAITLPTDADDFYGWLFADVENIGSIFERRFASSEVTSEESSPWSPTADPGDAISTKAGNVRINVYAERIEVEGYFDATKINHTGMILIFPRLGYTYPSCRLHTIGLEPVLTIGGESITVLDCLT